MAKLIYSALTSLDGFVEDQAGNFDFAEPDEEVFGFVNDMERPVGTYLYGRRMYETMVFWETAQTAVDQPPCFRDFTEMWQAADKIVYSTTLDAVTSARTRLLRAFDPRVIQEMKASQERDITIAGANLAAQAFEAGVVDECQLYLTPVVVGVASRPCRAASTSSSSSWPSAASRAASSSSITASCTRSRAGTPHS